MSGIAVLLDICAARLFLFAIALDNLAHVKHTERVDDSRTGLKREGNKTMTTIVCGVEINGSAEVAEAKLAERARNTCQECGDVSYDLEAIHELSDSAHEFNACPECAAIIHGVLDSAENQGDYDYVVALSRPSRKPIVSERAYAHAAAVNGPFRMLVGADCPF